MVLLPSLQIRPVLKALNTEITHTVASLVCKEMYLIERTMRLILNAFDSLHLQINSITSNHMLKVERYLQLDPEKGDYHVGGFDSFGK